MVVKTRFSGRAKAALVTPDLVALEAIYEAVVRAYLQGELDTKSAVVAATPTNVCVSSRDSKR
jgi:hypothetical protein